jgi:phosphate:Na+ symporter
VAPFIGAWLLHVRPYLGDPATVVVLFHLSFNVVVAVAFIGLTNPVARLGRKNCCPRPRSPPPAAAPPPGPVGAGHALAGHLECARARRCTRPTWWRPCCWACSKSSRKTTSLAEELRKMDDSVDQLYSSIKYYLTKISREALAEEESRRWTDIISFTINMEQIGDIIERVLIDIEDKKIKPGRNFSEAGMAEICELHNRLVDNLRLGMSVFLNGSVRDAQKLLEEKARFRDLERAYATTHLGGCRPTRCRASRPVRCTST